MRFCPRCGSRYEHERFCPEDGVATEPLPNAGPQKDALIGTVVDGRYRMEAQIGEGGMGVVYKATHVSLNKTLALKLLRGEMAKDAEVVQRFIQEAQAATSIGHENIIDINDFGRLPDGTVYFVMEYLNGMPLNDLIKRGGSIPVGQAVEIIRQIADALGAAHQRGIIHRDMKPDNVYIVARGETQNFVKVLDFGIAKVGGASNKLTRTGMVFGTPHYMSPEQAAGQSVDARTDIYALGVIMYEMFTGRVPFDADTFMGVLTKHMFEKPEPMNQAGAERQLGALEQITMRALEKKPENRYQTMQELSDDLERVLGGGKPMRAAQMGQQGVLADALEPRTRSEMRLEEQLAGGPSLPGERKTWPFIAGGAALLVIVVVSVFAFGGDSESAAIAPVPTPPSASSSVPAPPAPAPVPTPSPAQPVLGAETALSVVLLDSTPSGATLVMDGAIVGRTPAQFPRPSSGVRVVELRLDGYGRESVKVSAASPDQLNVALKRRGSDRPAPAKTKKAPAAKSEPKTESKKTPRSEVVDPWAN
jgi:tRNA A-37 threonylcarbamoyl transferase component Bud32